MAWNDELTRPSASNLPSTTVVEPGGGASSVFNFTSTTAAVVLPENLNRRLFGVYNDGAGTLYLKLGDGVTVASFTVKLVPNAYYETDRYIGLVTGIFDVAGSARVTEVTA